MLINISTHFRLHDSLSCGGLEHVLSIAFSPSGRYLVGSLFLTEWILSILTSLDQTSLLRRMILRFIFQMFRCVVDLSPLSPSRGTLERKCTRLLIYFEQTLQRLGEFLARDTFPVMEDFLYSGAEPCSKRSMQLTTDHAVSLWSVAL
ncbi:hypothetical protein T11_18273 [Trichinella zimbabwensis]|uniref:Uncharacterized protein n=1 Tax=Trichinella zimbabwensis TaxID=268475 RepID=A0A0V1H2S5_9BILA|nr:hypothetical protein T11_18273 [Trichinella zimbabwensis]